MRFYTSLRIAAPTVVVQALLHDADSLVTVNDVGHQHVVAVENLQCLHANLGMIRIHQVAQEHKERSDVLLELDVRQQRALLQNALPQLQQRHTLPLTFHAHAHLLGRTHRPFGDRHVHEVVDAALIDVEKLEDARQQHAAVLLHHSRNANHHEQTLAEHPRRHDTQRAASRLLARMGEDERGVLFVEMLIVTTATRTHVHEGLPQLHQPVDLTIARVLEVDHVITVSANLPLRFVKVEESLVQNAVRSRGHVRHCGTNALDFRRNAHFDKNQRRARRESVDVLVAAPMDERSKNTVNAVEKGGSHKLLAFYAKSGETEVLL